jgi:DNA helicase MCM8
MDNKDAGRVPRTVEVELSEDLVDSCVPGDIVTICGEVKVMSAASVGIMGTVQSNRPQKFAGGDGGGLNNKSNKSLKILYIEANSIESQSRSINSSQEENQEEMNQFSPQDLQVITEIYQENSKIFRLLVHSISPGIFGHDLVKAGLCLILFGGNSNRHVTPPSPSTTASSQNVPGIFPTKLSIRGDPHILIVGDPGMGKSQMLTSIHKIAPRAVYVCGTYSTGSGLTVTLLKESGSGDYALEAGALVLADQVSIEGKKKKKFIFKFNF